MISDNSDSKSATSWTNAVICLCILRVLLFIKFLAIFDTFLSDAPALMMSLFLARSCIPGAAARPEEGIEGRVAKTRGHGRR